jgi:UbiD family decarboxylase
MDMSVDDDIDPTNVHRVLWAMATRSRPAQSIDILRETWSTYLDPSLNPPEIRPMGLEGADQCLYGLSL